MFMLLEISKSAFYSENFFLVDILKMEENMKYIIKDYIDVHLKIQEAIKQLKKMKELRALREAEIADFLSEKNTAVVDVQNTPHRLYRYDDRIMLYTKKVPAKNLKV